MMKTMQHKGRTGLVTGATGPESAGRVHFVNCDLSRP